MSSEEIVISVKNVSKDFKLPHQKVGSIKSGFTSLLSFKKKGYEVQHALRDIEFSVKKGEFFGIVGRNGSGKSTLLKLLAGIYQPTKGGVRVDGRVVPFIELGVGFNGDLSGRDNVYLNGAMLGFSEKEIDMKYQDIVDFAELERFMDQKLKNYSSGMQVRLAFSVATRLAESDVLLIDEVLAVGDADFQRKCFRYFKQLKKEGKTVIFVTHDMNAVREYCDRAVFIEQSEMVALDSPEIISKMYEKLLIPKSSSQEVGEAQDKRWGDGTLKITHASASISKEKDVVLQMSVKANKSCDDPVLGFVVRNGSGTSLLGTNTIIQQAKIKPMEPGDELQLEWRFLETFADGDYTVTFAAQYDGGLTNGDWWEDACRLRISKPQHSPYPIDPGITVSVIRK